MPLLKIKPLEWKLVDKNTWQAKTPASHQGYISICFEEGLWWNVWKDFHPGAEDVNVLKARGEEFHQNFIKEYIKEYLFEDTPESFEKKADDFLEGIRAFWKEIEDVLENQDSRIRALNLGGSPE